MEESSSQTTNSSSKLVWDGDAKAVQQCLTDIFTSVYTTCDIPESAIFGPCVLSHTSLYDSIAFIALKATDKRTAPYIFRVDTSATNSTSEGLMWLRLVQSSRDRQEQNLEAYVKSGQLFYRSLRRIQKDEELLVWYGKELVELLLLTSGARAATAAMAAAKTKGSSPHSCPDCGQRFQFEFPFLAHLRFRCTKRLQQSLAGAEEEPAGKEERSGGTPTRSSPKLGRSEGFPGAPDTNKPSMDFHNLARDLENNRSSSPSDKEAEIRSESLGKRKFSETEEPPREPRVSGLATAAAATTKSKDELASSAQNYRGAYGLEEKRRAFTPPCSVPGGEPGGGGGEAIKRSAFTEVKKSGGHQSTGGKQHGAGKSLQSSANSENKEAGGGGGGGRPGSSSSSSSAGEKQHLNIRQVLSETQPPQTSPSTPVHGSAFTSVGQGKSAFSQPSRVSSSSSFAQMAGPLVMGPGGAKLLHGHGHPDCHPDALSSSGHRLYQAASDHLAAKLHHGGVAELGVGMAKQSPFVYAAAAAAATAFWPSKGQVTAVGGGPAATIQLQVPSALTLLPPSFTSLCLPAQNWCAKCNASFRMTSDLVYHMRSHHKKEFSAMEPLVKRRREEKLKCPICNESFRERHHLSRHMTSHN